MECVTCECVWLGAGWEVLGVSGPQDWALAILEDHGESGMCACVLVAVVLGESGWSAWASFWEGGLMSMCVVSLNSLC